jgi:peptidoglycan/xylan/chitin deacetylase (PgdA/CDA1 family)
MVKRIYNDGHVIGNYTWDHLQIFKLSPDKVYTELNNTSNFLFSLAGMYPALFRPSYGAASPGVISQVSSKEKPLNLFYI